MTLAAVDDELTPQKPEQDDAAAEAEFAAGMEAGLSGVVKHGIAQGRAWDAPSTYKVEGGEVESSPPTDAPAPDGASGADSSGEAPHPEGGDEQAEQVAAEEDGQAPAPEAEQKAEDQRSAREIELEQQLQRERSEHGRVRQQALAWRNENDQLRQQHVTAQDAGTEDEWKEKLEGLRSVDADTAALFDLLEARHKRELDRISEQASQVAAKTVEARTKQASAFEVGMREATGGDEWMADVDTEHFESWVEQQPPFIRMAAESPDVQSAAYVYNLYRPTIPGRGNGEQAPEKAPESKPKPAATPSAQSRRREVQREGAVNLRSRAAGSPVSEPADEFEAAFQETLTLPAWTRDALNQESAYSRNHK